MRKPIDTYIKPWRTQVLMDLGVIPWWTYEGFRYQFWRPLAELSHWLDHALWRDVAWWICVGTRLVIGIASDTYCHSLHVKFLSLYIHICSLSIMYYGFTHFTAAYHPTEPCSHTH